MSETTEANTPTTASAPSPPAPGRAFVTTLWTSVLTAARNDTPRAQVALEHLCQTYWPPLYAYARRRGYKPEDAQDLTQDFFAHLLKHNAVAAANRDKGRFRSFLLAGMNHFLADEWDKSRAQKRGGGKVISFDPQAAESWLTELSAKDLTPEKAFEKRWAITLLEQVYCRLEDEYRRQNKYPLFDGLRATLTGDSRTAPYAELARRLEMTEGAVKVAVHRLGG